MTNLDTDDVSWTRSWILVTHEYSYSNSTSLRNACTCVGYYNSKTWPWNIIKNNHKFLFSYSNNTLDIITWPGSPHTFICHAWIKFEWGSRLDQVHNFLTVNRVCCLGVTLKTSSLCVGAHMKVSRSFTSDGHLIIILIQIISGEMWSIRSVPNRFTNHSNLTLSSSRHAITYTAYCKAFMQGSIYLGGHNNITI